MRRRRLNSGYSGNTDQRRTFAGTIPVFKHYMERNLYNFFYGGNIWTPANISTDLWLDAADASTITESGGAVSQWDDKSGNDRNVVQAAAASRPTYNSSGFNGKPTLSFDGNNDNLKNVAYEPPGAVSAFIVYNKSAADGTLLNVQRSEGIFEITGKFSSSYKPITFTARGNINQAFGLDIAGDGIDENTILVLQHDGGSNTSGNFTVHLNGTLQNIVSSSALGYFAETGFSIGGRPVQNLAYCSCVISEIIFINDATSTENRQKIEGYLAHKWGLTSNLPVDHPYKTLQP